MTVLGVGFEARSRPTGHLLHETRALTRAPLLRIAPSAWAADCRHHATDQCRGRIHFKRGGPKPMNAPPSLSPVYHIPHFPRASLVRTALTNAGKSRVAYIDYRMHVKERRSVVDSEARTRSSS